MREAHRGDVLTADTTIRQGLRPGDVGAVTRLHGVLYEREHGLDHHIEASVAEGMARYADGLARSEGAALWLAEREGEIVGAVGITDQGDGVARLRWFIVAPQARAAASAAACSTPRWAGRATRAWTPWCCSPSAPW